jgi:hypothetical protein
MLVPVKNIAEGKGAVMKNNEELARIHAKEAIQQGLQAQRIHRLLSERREEQSHPRNFGVMQDPVTLNKKFLQLTTLFNRIYQIAILALMRD